MKKIVSLVLGSLVAFTFSSSFINLSITSATKYYSGHSDVMGGTLAVSKKVYKKVWWYNHLSGYRLSADDAYLVIRGIRTLDLRMDKHHANTLKVIKWLSKQKKILGGS